ncbi:hypothetical protein ACHAXA_007993 [Cyclostephanos tholiformis]|uniref:Transmembrane protein n=1 Tax=Cyclostephanos tholiformis TaxID=382380 RepID=A0ABD3RCU1_9STRA
MQVSKLVRNQEQRRGVDEGDYAASHVEPSAPPIWEMNTRIEDSMQHPPVALATPFPPPFAPHHHHEAWTASTTATAHEENYVVATPVLLPPPPTAPPLTTTYTNDNVDRRIERTNELDGSLSIVITTTTTRQIDGHREVRIETYRVPPGDEAGWAAALSSMSSSMSSSNTPGGAYLTRVEVRTYPPGHIVSSSDAAPTTTEEVGWIPDAGNARQGLGTMINPAYHRSGMSGRRRCCVLCGVCWGFVCVVLITLAILGAMVLPIHVSGRGGESGSGDDADAAPTPYTTKPSTVVPTISVPNPPTRSFE